MFKVTKYPHGTFSWADCSSKDYAKSKQFYVDVMGWGTKDLPLNDGNFYTMFLQDGADVGAVSGMSPQQAEMGMPSVWNSYITVDNVDALIPKVKELGGVVIVEPFDVFDSGRMAVLQDPTGAFVSLWQANKHIGSGLVNTPGSMTWNELTTKDAEKAKAFYSALLGWTMQKLEGAEYYVILNNGRSNGGIMQMSPDFGDMPSNWAVYYSVADIEATAKKVEAAGGKLIVPITDAGDIGRFVVAADPAGAVCAFIQTKAPEPWTE